VPYPLDYHEHAIPAARAAECANRLGDYDGFVNAVFEKQDSLGLKGWDSYAGDAGISDGDLVARCATGEVPMPHLDDAIAWGQRMLPGAGTPTVLVNGWRYNGVPQFAELEQVLGRVGKGKRPGKIRRPV
jgi:protein-disulfide isomerase